MSANHAKICREKGEERYFDSFYEAKVNDLLAEGFIVPDKNEEGYDEYKLKDDFLKNFLL